MKRSEILRLIWDTLDCHADPYAADRVLDVLEEHGLIYPRHLSKEPDASGLYTLNHGYEPEDDRE